MSWRSNETKEKLYEVINNEKEIIVFDTETTGLNKNQDVIIQISAIKFEIDNEGNLNKKDILDLYINPDYPLPPKITEITGINDELLEDKPLEEEAFKKSIYPFFGENPNIAAHNEKFDVGFMEELYKRNSKSFNPKYRLDTLEMARDLVDKKESNSFKLCDVAKYYGIDEGVEFHNALGDVSVTAKCIIIFYNEYRKKDNETNLKKDTIKPKVYSCNYWEKYKLKRIYVETDKGKVFYDIIGKTWNVCKDSVYDENEIDFEYIRKQCFEKYNIDNEKDFVYKIKH